MPAPRRRVAMLAISFVALLLVINTMIRPGAGEAAMSDAMTRPDRRRPPGPPAASERRYRWQRAADRLAGWPSSGLFLLLPLVSVFVEALRKGSAPTLDA
jgi:hypothetical protein